MHYPTEKIAHTTTIRIPVMEHCLDNKYLNWSTMRDGSKDLSLLFGLFNFMELFWFLSDPFVLQRFPPEYDNEVCKAFVLRCPSSFGFNILFSLCLNQVYVLNLGIYNILKSKCILKIHSLYK